MCTAESYDWVRCASESSATCLCATSAATSDSWRSSASTATTFPPEVRSLAREFDLGGVIFFARNVDAPEQVADLSRESQALAPEMPLWVSVDQEGGRVARLKRAVHRVAADDHARPRRRRGAGRAVCHGARGGAARRRHLARLHAGARRPHQPEEPGDRRSRAGRARRRRRAPRRRHHPRRCRPKASPPAASTFPGTATPAPTRISSCR